MKLTAKMAMVFSLVTLASCASHTHVRPGANGIHRVVIRGVEKETVERAAIREAGSFCGTKDLSPAFVEEKTAYTGSMDESTHKMIGKVSKAASAGGGMMGVMGGQKEKNVGQGIFGAGVVGATLQDEEAYTSDMSFKCI